MSAIATDAALGASVVYRDHRGLPKAAIVVGTETTILPDQPFPPWHPRERPGAR